MSATCRYCGSQLDDEEIFTALSKCELYAGHMAERLEKTARLYGWTPENRKCFRRDVIIQFADKPQIQICPDCNGVFPRNPNRPTQYYKPPP